MLCELLIWKYWLDWQASLEGVFTGLFAYDKERQEEEKPNNDKQNRGLEMVVTS